jgi:hypothetical protein
MYFIFKLVDSFHSESTKNILNHIIDETHALNYLMEEVEVDVYMLVNKATTRYS